MPELPEVEVIRRGLAPHVRERTLVAAFFSNKKLRKPMPRAKIRNLALGRRILAVERRAKFLLLHLDQGALLVFHLGMTGKLGIFPAGAPQRRHDHLRLLLDNDTEIRFNDIRRFGFVELFGPEDLQHHDPFAGLGPEPFARDFEVPYLLRKAKGRRQPVKNFLMDNRVVVGIGNIYANETLFAAGIRPETPAASLGGETWRKVIDQGRIILGRAIASGGTTISDFVNESGKAGFFQLELAVYGRDGQPCRQCETPIHKTVLAGRATYFCPTCQR